jgi:hypothetical protein
MNKDEFLKKIEDGFFAGIISKFDNFEDYPVEPEICNICEEAIETIGVGQILCKCGCKLINIPEPQNDCKDVGYFIIENLTLIKKEYVNLSKIKPFNKTDNSNFLREFHQWISESCLGGNTRWNFGPELKNIINLIEYHLSSDVDDVDDLDGFGYENFCKAKFEKYNWKARITSKSGDYGADIVAEKDNTVAVIQCKNHSKPAGIKSVQEVFASKKFYSANLAIVISKSGFTKQAVKLAKTTGVKYIHHNDISSFPL